MDAQSDKQSNYQSMVTGQRINPWKLDRAKELRRKMTRAEKVLWKELRGSRLNGIHFRRQQIVRGFIADFYCHSARLIVELDGPIHEDQQEYDQERDRILTSHHLKILRIPNHEVFQNLQQVLDRIQRSCETP